MTLLSNVFITENASIQDIVAGDFAPGGGDWVKIWDPDTRKYSFAYWRGDGVYEDEFADEPCADEGWADDNQTIVDFEMFEGKGFWAQAASGGFIRMAGTVTSNNVIDVPANRMVLIGNPYPVETDIQTIVASDGFALGGGDWIKIWNPDTRKYTFAYWRGDGIYEDEFADEPCADEGWADDNQTKINLILDVGQGFWCQAVAGGKLTFLDPLATK